MNPQPALGQTPRALGLRCPRPVALRPPWSLDSSDARLHRSPGASNREPRQDDVMDQLSETPLNGAEWRPWGRSVYDRAYAGDQLFERKRLADEGSPRALEAPHLARCLRAA